MEAGVPAHLRPASYPVACLLGCVTVVDCLAQDEYRRAVLQSCRCLLMMQFPHGDSLSPYVLICEDPAELPVYFPVKVSSRFHHQRSRSGAA